MGPLIDFLPHLIPNITKFHEQASKVMSLVRTLGNVLPLDLLKYYKNRESQNDEDDENEDYAFHYDLVEDEEEISPISLGSYAYLLFVHHYDKKYLPQFVLFIFSANLVVSLLQASSLSLLYLT